MGVAREFGPWALNAREFRRAGLNPRVWLARRVNQSATDAVGGAVIFSVKRRGPLAAGRPALSPGSADPLSSTDPLFSPPRSLPTIPSSGRSGPLPSTDPPHHSAVRRRGLPLSGGVDPLSPSPRTPSLRRRGPPLSVDADPLSPAARTPSLRRRGSPLTAVD
ncbi:hypothetical protein niasHT_016537 [Heterodera trifolii]|uniref:Uncharacterized protein n=1 Tax=Heterodera trifolii TaxID=157864 RepID=A0ABD2L435_9BILA